MNRITTQSAARWKSHSWWGYVGLRVGGSMGARLLRQKPAKQSQECGQRRRLRRRLRQRQSQRHLQNQKHNTKHQAK